MSTDESFYFWLNDDEELKIVPAEINDNMARVIPLEVGSKIECRDFMLEKIVNQPIVQNNFKLRIKRLNRWWYSVYFDKICKHKCEPLIFGEDKFCSDCREKL
jgi:hypothetical protein